jgi:hypothetical protein
MEREVPMTRNIELSDVKLDRLREKLRAIERWEAIREIAEGKASATSDAEQVRAIGIVLSTPRPPTPGPFDELSHEEFQAVTQAMRRGELPPVVEIALETPLVEPIELVRMRCLDELHAIIAGNRTPPVSYGVRMTAYKLYRLHAPEPIDPVAAELDGMTEEQLEDELRQLGIDPNTLEPFDASSEDGGAQVAA